jgi:hypothetical protein
MNLAEVLRAAALVVELLRLVSDLRTKQNGSTSDLDHPDDRRSTAAHSDPASPGRFREVGVSALVIVLAVLGVSFLVAGVIRQSPLGIVGSFVLAASALL